MPNAYKEIPVSVGHNIDKGGVFLLAHPSISENIRKTLHKRVYANATAVDRTAVEHCAIVSVPMSKTPVEWSIGLAQEYKNILISYWKKITQQNVKIALEKLRMSYTKAQTFIRPNGMLAFFLRNFDSKCKENGGSIYSIPMDALIGIEPAGNANIEKYPSHCFGYFGGSQEETDASLYDTCMREAVEECNVIFHESVLELDYQNMLRDNIQFVPLHVDTQFKNTNLYSRVYVILLGPDVVLVEQPDHTFLAKRA